MATGNTRYPTGAQHMYTLEYRFRKTNGRLTKWFNVSRHDLRDDARKAFTDHISTYPSSNARIVRNFDGQVVGEYKFKRG